MKQKASGVHQRPATIGGVADQADHRRPPARRRSTVRRQWGRVSIRPVAGSTSVGVVVLPAGLVLLGAVVVVEAEQDRPGLLGRRAQVDGRLAAPGADLDEGGRRAKDAPGPQRRHGRGPRPRRRA